VRRRSHCKGIQQEAELLALLLGRDVEQVEDLRLQLGLVIRKEPPAISIPFTTRS